MKQSTLAMKLTMSVLVVGILAYLGFYTVTGWSDGLVTTTAYLYTVNEGVECRGTVIREEQVISGGESSHTDLIPSEGERVGKGQTVAILYSDSSGVSTRQRIRTLEAEIRQLEYALSSGAGSTDVTRLDGDVLASITALRAMSARDDLSTLEDAALELRTRVFKREDTYGDKREEGHVTALIATRRAELEGLDASLSSVSTTIAAPSAGTFSGVADGYESVLTPDLLPSLTAEELDALLSQPVTLPADAVGKLVTSSTWYFAAPLPIDAARALVEGDTYAISFSHDYFGLVDMELIRLDVPREGEALALFAARTNLSDITAIRQQSVDVVTRQVEGIRIPRRALRVRTETVSTKHEDGTETETEVQVTGVYIVIGTRAEWQPVEVLHTGDSFYLVAPARPEDAKRLREGDEVILSSDVHHGKVVR